MARTHAVRNAYGHIEYLTDSEIANLRERGEDIDVVDNYRGHPPYAKNPANQAYINECWYNEQKEKEEKRKERQRGRQGREPQGDSSSGGSTMYDRRARTGSEPAGASGEIDPRTGKGHGSQWYDDGYRVSRDTDGQGDQRVHWTDERIPKGKRRYDERHTPPSDAR